MKTYKYIDLDKLKEEMKESIDAQKENENGFKTEFYRDWCNDSEHSSKYLGDYTYECWSEDEQQWISAQSLGDLWEMGAEDYLNTIKKLVIERISDEIIFSRMTEGELEEYKRVEKELILYKVLKKV